MAQTVTTQLGSNAVAPPAMPVPNESLPEQHHLKEPEQTSSTQLGPGTIAPPATHTAAIDEDLVYPDLPPFPEDVPTAPLLRLSLRKLAQGDADEKERLWRASCDVGFFYLDLRNSNHDSKRDSAQDLLATDTSTSEAKDNQIDGAALIRDAEKLFKLGEQVYALPVEEKQKYDFKDRGSYFGYKGFGAGVIDSKGTRDRNEFYNVSKDDILGLGERLPAPDVLEDEGNRNLLRNYMVRSHAVITLLLGVLNEKLSLPPETLQHLHRLRGVSGDQVRWVRSPPQVSITLQHRTSDWKVDQLNQPLDDRGKALGEHTDFGSMTVLFNRLGGLQILPPDSEQWCYVKPLRGHCVCNLGDAMVKFTAGVLRSNIHRVVNPPGEQGDSTRMSLVYFARPEDEVILQTLEGSELIDEKRKGQVS